jgi:hypothetical protein
MVVRSVVELAAIIVGPMSALIGVVLGLVVAGRRERSTWRRDRRSGVYLEYMKVAAQVRMGLYIRPEERLTREEDVNIRHSLIEAGAPVLIYGSARVIDAARDFYKAQARALEQPDPPRRKDYAHWILGVINAMREDLGHKSLEEDDAWQE